MTSPFATALAISLSAALAALPAMCVHAAAPGRLERVAASPELRKELARYGLEAGKYVQPKAGCASAEAGRERHRRVTGRPFPSSLSYLLYVPKGQKSRKVPLLIYLPGSGERGEDLMRQFHQRTVFARVTSAEFQARHPCYMLALSPPEGVGTFLDGEPGRPSAIQDLIAGAVSAVMAAHGAPPVDANRIYATGLSLGGEGVYGLAFAFPGLFAAGIPVAAGPPPADYLSVGRPGRWWHFYNEGDYQAKRIDPAALDVFRKAVEDAGGEFRTGTYPATGHNALDAAWREADVWEWLFSKTADGRPAEPSRPASSKRPAPAAKSPAVICTASRPGRDGGTGPEQSICAVFADVAVSALQLEDSVAHEFGHRFFIRPNRQNNYKHVDSFTVHQLAHDGNDECLMSYNRNRGDANAELCVFCLLLGSQANAADSIRKVEDK